MTKSVSDNKENQCKKYPELEGLSIGSRFPILLDPVLLGSLKRGYKLYGFPLQDAGTRRLPRGRTR